MKNYLLLFMILLLFLSCSHTSNKYIERQGKSSKKIQLVERIDSSIVKAAVKPLHYLWNKEGNLVDIIRKKYNSHKIEPGYPNPFSPPTFITFSIIEPDSIKFFICNENESSCYKFQEGYFESGYYSLGFQKFDVDTCRFVFKIVTRDTTVSSRSLFMP